MTTPLSYNENFRLGEVSYNGVRFPPAIQSQAKFTPEYDDSGRIMKYLRGTLSLEAYIFPGCLGTTNSLTSPVGYRPATIVGVDPIGAGDLFAETTTEVTMEEIRHRLSEPCQALRFHYQGVGDINLNNPLSPSPKDVDNGPKPTEVRWTPMTNKMAKVEWEVSFAFCPSASPVGYLPSTIAQFPFEVNHSIAEDGTTIRTITGCIEIPLTRVSTLPVLAAGGPSNSTSKAHAGISQPFDMLALEQKVSLTFPILKQFKRTQNFTLSKDRKRLDFVITDSEINSDQAYGPGIANEDVKLTAEGSLKPGGFQRWSMNLSGQLELMAGYPKSFGLAEIAKLSDYYYLTKGRSGHFPPTFLQKVANYISPGAASGAASRVILTNVKYEDHLFSRTMGFSISWDLYITLADLFTATGLFQPYSTTETLRTENWTTWKLSQGFTLDRGGYQQLGLTQSDDIIVSLCIPQQGGMKPRPTIPPPQDDPTQVTQPPNPFSGSDSQSAADAQAALNLYAGYDCRFYIDAVNTTLNHIPLSYLPIIKEVAKTPQAVKQQKETIFPPASIDNGNSSTPIVLSHRTRPTTYILTCVGAAVRLGYAPIVPNVESYGGQPLTKFGTDIIRPYNLGAGVDTTVGQTYAVNGLMWKKQYILPGTPTSNIIVSDGHTGIYT